MEMRRDVFSKHTHTHTHTHTNTHKHTHTHTHTHTQIHMHILTARAATGFSMTMAHMPRNDWSFSSLSRMLRRPMHLSVCVVVE